MIKKIARPVRKTGQAELERKRRILDGEHPGTMAKPWSVADTKDTYKDTKGRTRYRVKARFETEDAAVNWLTTQNQRKVARGDFEICGPKQS